MLEETGSVVKIEADALWVETVQRTSCGSCSAQKGCGQRVLGEAFHQATRLKVMLNGRSPNAFRLEQCVTIGIPESAVVTGSLTAYLLPVAVLIGGVAIAGWLGLSEGQSVFSGLVGFFVGWLLVRCYARRIRHNPKYQPVLLEK